MTFPDGTRSALSRYGASLAGRYRWRPRLSFEARWAYDRTRFVFAGDSQRATDATDGKRTDQEHNVSVGARWAF